MASINALNSALSGLRIAQNNIGLISTNISNVNTVGYTRKTQEQYTIMNENVGAGALAGTIERAVDAFLKRELMGQIGTTAGLETKQRYLQQIQEFHGPAESENAISNQINKLKNAFQELANDPSKDYLLNNVYQESVATVDKMHDFSDLITQMRNDSQNEMKQIVNEINTLTKQIEDYNLQIKGFVAVNQSTADLEDQRDIALKQLSEYIDVSYYERGDKVLVVQTQQGTPLVEDKARTLYFNPQTIGPLTTYPVSVASIRLDDPTTGTNLTDQDNIGGALGSLIELRDETLPQYQAQLDELAYRMAERFDSQGLRLFSLPNESIPLDDPTQPPPLGYAGFSNFVEINPDIVADKTLIRTGTTGNTVTAGSAEQVRKIVDYAFGANAYQQGLSTTDVSSLNMAGVSGTSIITSYGALDTHPDINPGTNDTFSIQLGAGAPVNITITAGQTAADLVNTINASFPNLAAIGANGNLYLKSNQDITIGDVNMGVAGLDALGLTAGATPVANVDTLFNQFGLASRARIVGATDIESLGVLDQSDYIRPVPAAIPRDTFQITVGAGAPTNITINGGDTIQDVINQINTTYPGLASLGPNGNLVMTSQQSLTIADGNLGTQGLSELGLTAGTTATIEPSFTVQLGNKEPVTINITNTDTNVELLAKLNAIDGIEASLTTPDGFLRIMPSEGGQLTLTDGPSNPLAQMGISVSNVAHTAFKSANVGPGGVVSSTKITASSGLVEYATLAVTQQTQDATNVETTIQGAQVYRDTLQSRLTNESAVNIDEEMANLIQMQNNYAASAKAIQVIDEMFDSLLSAVLR